MREIKDSQRSTVRIGYDGRVHKTFRGRLADQRFANEVRILNYLQAQGCDFVPQVLEADPRRLTLVTTNCGPMVDKLSEARMKSLFDRLEREFGVRHDDPFARNITYDPRRGAFCVIDFELSEITRPEAEDHPAWTEARKGPDMSAAPPEEVFNPLGIGRGSSETHD